MIQQILTILALIFAIYLLIDAFGLKPNKSNHSTKACGMDNKSCGCG